MRIGTSKDKRFYLIDGERYARVTQAVEHHDRRGLEAWRERVGEEEADRISQEAATEGEMIHRVTAASDLLQTGAVDTALRNDPWMIPFWAAWFNWAEANVVRWVAVEQVIWSKKLRVAGRVDRVGIMRGDKNASIIDIKTGSVGDDAGVQVAGAYLPIYNGWRPRGWPRADRAVVVHLPRKNPGHLAVREFTGRADAYARTFQERLKDYTNASLKDFTGTRSK